MIKRTILSVLTIFVAGLFSVANAQQVDPPPISDNATPADTNIKMRSVELERVKREAEKTATLRRDDGKELNFSIVKEDFEDMQKEQMLIIEAYQKSKEIDYKQITKSSNKITEMAIRLRANVFDSKPEGDTSEPEPQRLNRFAGKSVRDLIVALDNAIGDVVDSPMWQQLKVVDRAVSEPVEASLIDVIDASSALWIESRKKTEK